MKKGKLVLLAILVLSLCFFLTGCFDMSTVINIKSSKGEGNAKVTITTPSEEAFEMVKSSAYQEDLIGPDQPDSIESTIREEGGVYSLEVKGEDFQLGNTDIEVNKEGDQITYTLEEVIVVDEDATQEEDMDYSSWFEGYSYKFTVYLPDKIQKAWWIDSDHQRLEEVEQSYLDSDTLSFEIPMDKLLSKENKGKWTDHWGVIIQTDN